MALYQLKNGECSAEHFTARMELLERNKDFESKSAYEKGQIMKEFFDLSHLAKEACDHPHPFVFYDDDDSDDSDSRYEDYADESEDEFECEYDAESVDECHGEFRDKANRVCIRKVIIQEQERFPINRVLDKKSVNR